MKIRNRWLRAGIACAAIGLGAGVTPRTAHAIDYNVAVRVYCATGTFCGFNTRQEMEQTIREAFARVNTIWRPTEISFRIQSISVTQDSVYSSIVMNGSHDALDLVRIGQLHQLAATTPDVITYFMLPLPSYCWSDVPPLSGDGWVDTPSERHGLFCLPFGDFPTYAHELAHHFCLAHPHTQADPADTGFSGHDGDGLSDTPTDPAPAEIMDHAPSATDGTPDFVVNAQYTGGGHTPTDPSQIATLYNNRDWCDWIPAPVDPGSPMAQACTAACVGSRGGAIVGIDHAPRTELIISYYKGVCNGPYVINGQRTEAFTPMQLARVRRCQTQLPERMGLADACAGMGGDSDHDGLCDAEDRCPVVPSLGAPDTDGDGTPDLCDLCANDPSPETTDTDGDGAGDLCDPDDDNDGCGDAADQHPQEARPQVGLIASPGCGSTPIRVFEGSDTDHDGTPNCRDTDDDGDGLADAVDPCPASATQLCTIPGVECPTEFTWWTLCRGAGCGGFELVIEDLITLRQVVIHPLDIREHALILWPSADHTLSEVALALRGGPTPSVSARATLRLWIRNAATGARAALLAEYRPADVRSATGEGGNLMMLRFDSSAGFEMGRTWSAIALPGEVGPDADGDGVPDAADNCVRSANPGQRDGDGDQFGDACDADVDQDSAITDRDVRLVRGCEGVDLATLLLVPDLGDRSRRTTPPSALLRRAQCGRFDLDGNGLVTARDTALVTAQLGGAPGPSGLRPVVPATPGDAGTDAAMDASNGGGTPSDGCGCRTPTSSPSSDASRALAVAALIATLARRRRARRTSSASNTRQGAQAEE
jgi:hypothetical protein